MPHVDLLSPCVPIGWQVATLERLGEDEIFGLDRGRRAVPSVYASLGGPVGDQSMDLV